LFKAGMIGNPGILDALEDRREDLFSGDATSWMDLVVDAIEVKRDVVVKDERESGIRAILNLGHTFGHAIESAVGHGTLTHGEAVSLGMVMATRVSAMQGFCSPDLPDWLAGRLGGLGLPVDPSSHAKCGWEETLLLDKKASGDRIGLIVPLSVGEVKVLEVEQGQAIFWLQAALSG
jgi:3-dehydroquinate synthase